MVNSQDNLSGNKYVKVAGLIIIFLTAAVVFFMLIYKANLKIVILDQKIADQQKQLLKLQSDMTELRQVKKLSESESKNKPDTTAQEDIVDVVVAKSPLKIGAKLGPENITTIKMKKENAPTHSYNDAQALIGKMVSSPISSKEAITSAKLFDMDVISQKVSPGYRAITVSTDKILGLSPLVKPGSMLDIFALIPKIDKAKNSKDTKTTYKTSKLLMTNIKVLNISNNQDPLTKEFTSNSITFIVPNDKVPDFVLAINGIGVEIQLVVRSKNDTSEITKTVIDTNELLGGSKEKSKAPPQINLPKKSMSKSPDNKFKPAKGKLDSTSNTKQTYNIEVIKANNRNNVTFEKNP